MATPAPHAHRVSLREVSTGREFDAWPVDAREIVRHSPDLYVYATDLVVAPPANGAASRGPDAPAEPPAVSPTEQLSAKSGKALQALAKQAGIHPKQSRDALVAALLPHVAAGTVSLADVSLLPASLDAVQFPGARASED